MNILVGLEWPYTSKAPEEIHVPGYNLAAFLSTEIVKRGTRNGSGLVNISDGLLSGYIFTALPYLLISPHTTHSLLNTPVPEKKKTRKMKTENKKRTGSKY